jgi:hypothetical protein|tara:strand:- start:51 stop:638 length:588 start_codon:yes stop_codon:yes gene_type:complete
MLTAINLSDINLADVLEENTEALAEREAENNKWMNEDGTPKKNYVWKYASKTPQGDAGESVVATSIFLLLTKVYGDNVQCRVINKGKGEYDILINLPDGREYKIEVKTATEDVNGCHQFNGLRKDVNYDFAFLFGVAPEDFFFEIASHEYLCETMTTNMSKEVVGSYKHTIAQKNLTQFNTVSVYNALCAVGIIK